MQQKQFVYELILNLVARAKLCQQVLKCVDRRVFGLATARQAGDGGVVRRAGEEDNAQPALLFLLLLMMSTVLLLLLHFSLHGIRNSV